MGYVLSVDTNKPYEDRATGISGAYSTAKSGVEGVYNTAKQGYANLYGQQKTSTSSAYDTLLSGQTAAQGKRYEAAQEPYKYNMSQADTMYQPVRNELYTQNSVAERALRERLANIGASGSGGLSQRKQQDLGLALQKGLTSADLEQQGYIDEQERGLTQLGYENEAQLLDITSQNEYSKSQALADLEAKLLQSGIDMDSDLGKQIIDLTMGESSALSQNELAKIQAEQSQKNTDLNMYLNMYLNGRISKQQFRDMTGMEI